MKEGNKMSKIIKSMLQLGSASTKTLANGKNHRVVNRGKVSYFYYKNIRVAALLKDKKQSVLILSNMGITDGWMKKRLRAYCYEANKLNYTVVEIELIENPLQNASILLETIRDENFKVIKQDVLDPCSFTTVSKIVPGLKYYESDYISKREVC